MLRRPLQSNQWPPLDAAGIAQAQSNLQLPVAPVKYDWHSTGIAQAQHVKTDASSGPSYIIPPHARILFGAAVLNAIYVVRYALAHNGANTRTCFSTRAWMQGGAGVIWRVCRFPRSRTVVFGFSKSWGGIAGMPVPASRRECAGSTVACRCASTSYAARSPACTAPSMYPRHLQHGQKYHATAPTAGEKHSHAVQGAVVHTPHVHKMKPGMHKS